jgi:hypothetical protein
MLLQCLAPTCYWRAVDFRFWFVGTFRLALRNSGFHPEQASPVRRETWATKPRRRPSLFLESDVLHGVFRGRRQRHLLNKSGIA